MRLPTVKFRLTPFASGHWVPEMVDLAGGRDVLGRAGQPSYPTTWEAVAEAGPELIVAAPCGFDRERAEAVYRGVPDPLVAEDVADCIAWCVTRPHHVNVDRLVVRPLAQAAQHKVHRV